jgi:poly-gamma-glutamate capsule biosynthesis protein CapA/YwtB (metallophosphatase superfamily)
MKDAKPSEAGAASGAAARLLLYAVGDVAPSRARPETLFEKLGGRLREADIAFCQLEINITERGARLPQVRHTDRTTPAAAQALRDAGFGVVSFAGNHCMDWGPDGFHDTLAACKQAGLALVGVGSNIAEARKPLVIRSKGQRVAFLAYSSILPLGFWAEHDRAGCAPMRAHTVYEAIEPDQPGTPARIHTFPHRGDLAAMIDDIGRAKAQADVVVVSMHWGIHFVPALIADYQRDVGRAAIDAGADLILGHHAHILKGADVYKGKPILYSLCNFAVDLPMTPEHAASQGFREIQKLHADWQPDFDSTYNFPPESRRTVIAKCVIEGGELQGVSLLPAYIDRQSRPEILMATDPRFAEVADYLDAITRDQGLSARYVRRGDELLVMECETAQELLRGSESVAPRGGSTGARGGADLGRERK